MRNLRAPYPKARPLSRSTDCAQKHSLECLLLSKERKRHDREGIERKTEGGEPERRVRWGARLKDCHAQQWVG